MWLVGLAGGCALLDLAAPPDSDNAVAELRIVTIQPDPPVISPNRLFFIDVAVANPAGLELRGFVFACVPGFDDGGLDFGIPVSELFLFCNDETCTDVRATVGFSISEQLLSLFDISGEGPFRVDLPLFVAVCETETCPAALTDPQASPVTALGLDGSRPPPEGLVPETFAVTVQSIAAKPNPEPGDSNPSLDLLESPAPTLAAGETSRLTFGIGGGGRGVGNRAFTFTTGGRFAATNGATELSGLRRGDVARFEFTMPSPPEPTTVWLVLDENGSSAGDVYTWTFMPP